MKIEEWKTLSKEDQNLLAAKHGLTRSGLNNDLLSEEELIKIPEQFLGLATPVEIIPVEEEQNEVSKKTRAKKTSKEAVKLSGRGRVVSKPVKGKKK